jgi:hypothetical protein
MKLLLMLGLALAFANPVAARAQDNTYVKTVPGFSFMSARYLYNLCQKSDSECSGYIYGVFDSLAMSTSN